MGRAATGTIRKLPSGRYQARITGPDGRRHSAPSTFQAKRDAQVWLAQVSADISRGRSPFDASSGESTMNIRFDAYAQRWLERRRVRGAPLADRTLAEYRGMLRRRILPEFGTRPVHTITRRMVDDWYDAMPADRPTERAHCYALLKSILATAVVDGHLASNPATVRGGGTTRRARRVRPLTLPEIVAVADAMPPRYRLAVLLSGTCGLRYGELAELRRSDIDTAHGTVMVRRAVVRVQGRSVVKPPKSDAGVRDVSVPGAVMPSVRRHLLEHCAPGDDGLVFPSLSDPGRHLAETTLLKMLRTATVAALGRDDVRLHDLRHSAANLATQNRATLAEVMHRLGHSTPAAAMRYQSASGERDRLIAQSISDAMGLD